MPRLFCLSSLPLAVVFASVVVKVVSNKVDRTAVPICCEQLGGLNEIGWIHYAVTWRVRASLQNVLPQVSEEAPGKDLL